jgi:hypothetical protein
MQWIFQGLCLYLLTEVLPYGKEFNWIGTKRVTRPPKFYRLQQWERQEEALYYIPICDFEDVQY